MRTKSRVSCSATVAVLLVLAGVLPCLSQEGKLDIHATPKQAYIFVDDHAMGEASRHHSLKLSPGDHKVELVNYGFTPVTQTITVTSGKTSKLEIALQAVTPTVSPAFGAMTIEGASQDAVLLNGKTPDFFVGHGDEFDHNWWWRQELVVPPGTYQMTILGPQAEVWSGSVEVPANQRVVIDIPKGVHKTVPWPRGEKLSALPRFTVGTASATVAVAKPTAELSASVTQVNCGDGSQLKWSSTDAPSVGITPIGSVAPSGAQAVQPTQTTTYQLTAVGPGGTTNSSATVNVNTAVQANLQLAPAEVRYKRVGDKVEQGSTALNWSAANASTVSIDSLGTVDASGTRTLPVTPKKTDPGPVDETVTYTLNASNVCGGTETKTATLHIVGVIEAPDTGLALNSVYFPTDVPRSIQGNEGLVASQQATLTSVAGAFKNYLVNNPDAHLTLIGHADKRGTNDYNKALSDRRTQVARNFLIEQGIAADHLDTQGLGDDQNLTADQVKQLIEQNPDLNDEERQKALDKLQTLVFANNRRVDITLSTTGQESARQYPFKAEDFTTLVNRNGVEKESVQMAAEKKKIEN